MQSHLVSIIIPVYNSASYVEETLKACIKQSYQNLEIIVVNDGSTDNSEEIILGVADERILYHLIENGGACVARNYGIKQSKGELIQFLDADDILDDDKIMHQVAKYNLHGDEYVYSGVMGTVTGDVKTLQDGYDLYRRDFDPLSYFEVLLNQFGKYLTTGIWLVKSGW
jgi:glycosyltransferase involved in cell wall biosynthesis